MRGTLHVFTYKDGLLARLAHDLRVSVGRFEVRLEGDRVRASFDPASARVDGVAHGERVDAAALSEKDKRTIEATIAKEILGPSPVTFEGTVSGGKVRGRLAMRGQAREIEVPVALGDEVRVETELVPTRWGVAPFKSLAGAIKLQDRWRVRLVLDGPLADGTWTP